MTFWPSHAYYFVTSKTFLGNKIFDNNEKKRIVLNKIREAVKKLNIPIYAYSIAQNHHHTFLFFDNYKKHAKFKQFVNGGSAFIFNRLYKLTDNTGTLWHDSKSLIAYNPKSLLNIIGYIAGNLLKHNEVNNFNELKKCPFSSYRQLVAELGDDEAEIIVRRVIKIDESNEYLIDLDKL